MVKCSNCGGIFENTLPECPYCGNINYQGAEIEYKEKLEEVRSELDDLSDIHFSEYKSEVKKQTKGVGKIIAIVVGFVLFLFAITLVGEYVLFKPQDSDEIKAQMKWERENFPALDTLYEEEKYDELFEHYIEITSDNDYSIYYWDHADFLVDYGYYYDYKLRQGCLEKGEEIDKYDIGFMVYDVIYFTHEIDFARYKDNEKEFFEKRIEEISNHLATIIDIDNEEFDKIYALATKKGFIDVGEVIDYMEKNLERVKL